MHSMVDLTSQQRYMGRNLLPTLMENKECIVERVSGTAVQSGDEKDATKKRNDCTKASVKLECEVIELGKLNCSSI